jgi:hypothetical protein
VLRRPIESAANTGPSDAKIVTGSKRLIAVAGGIENQVRNALYVM